MTDGLTAPEDRTERSRGWRLVDKVRACGGCAACQNRAKDVLCWGRSVCGMSPALTFPACVNQTPGFAPDHAVLYGKGVVE